MCYLFIGGPIAFSAFCFVTTICLTLEPFVLLLLLFQRFALAAAELNGVIYAVGGYDGKDYLM